MKWRLDPGQIEVLDKALADVLRRKTPAEKIQMVAAAQPTARKLIGAGVRHQHRNGTTPGSKPKWQEIDPWNRFNSCDMPSRRSNS